MPAEQYPSPFGEIRAASTAGTGTALTTTAVFIQLPDGTFFVRLQPRNQTATTLATRIAFNPWLAIIKTSDSFATAGALTDGSIVLQDALTTTTFNVVLDTLANGDALYIGSHLPFRGVNVVMDGANVNATASILTVQYWKKGAPAAWASITPTDGTAAAGATFGQSGNVTWTVPTDWQVANLDASNYGAIPGIAETGSALKAVKYSDRPLYWTRWTVSVVLDAGTAAQTMNSMNRSTAYWDIPFTQVVDTAAGTAIVPWWDFLVDKGIGGVSNIEALTQASTCNLIVDCATRPQTGFTVNL